MAQHVLDLLKERGFIAQMTFEDELYEQLKNPTTFYVGFDPTADSLHIGHYIPIMAMAHMQRAGHRPIALMGGGTAMIGDPSGKSDMRKMMTVETIDSNVAHIKQQMSRFLDFSEGKAIIANNGDWLRSLNFIEFMRDIGSMFSVNKMLTAECYKARMATDNGLSFLEFTYMLMQSYDFLELFKKYGCRLEMGGNDQWSNMLGGADLIRRKERKMRLPAPSSSCSPTTAARWARPKRARSGSTRPRPAPMTSTSTGATWTIRTWRSARPADLPADGRGSPHSARSR